MLWGTLPLFQEKGYLASVDTETLTSEKHVADKCLQAEPCYIQVKITGKAEGTPLPMGALQIILIYCNVSAALGGEALIWYL